MYDSNQDHSFESDFLGQFNKPKPHNWNPSGAGGSGVEVTDELINNIKGSIKTSEMCDNTRSKFLNALHNVTKYEIQHPEGYDKLLYAYSTLVYSNVVYIYSVWKHNDLKKGLLVTSIFDSKTGNLISTRSAEADLSAAEIVPDSDEILMPRTILGTNNYVFCVASSFVEMLNNGLSLINLDYDVNHFCCTSKHIITLSFKDDEDHTCTLAIYNRAGFIIAETDISNLGTGNYIDVTTDGNYIYLLYGYPEDNKKTPEIFVYDYNLQEIKSNIDLSKYYTIYQQNAIELGHYKAIGLNYNTNKNESLDFYGIDIDTNNLIFHISEPYYYYNYNNEMLYNADFSKGLDNEMFMVSHDSKDAIALENNNLPILHINPIETSDNPEVVIEPTRITTKYAFRDVTIKIRAYNMYLQADTMPILLKSKKPSGRFSGDYMSFICGKPHQNSNNHTVDYELIAEGIDRNGFKRDIQSESTTIDNPSGWHNYEIRIINSSYATSKDVYETICTMSIDNIQYSFSCRPDDLGFESNVARDKGVHITLLQADPTMSGYVSHFSIERATDSNSCKVANTLLHRSVYKIANLNYKNTAIVDFNNAGFYRGLAILANANESDMDAFEAAILQTVPTLANTLKLKDILCTHLAKRKDSNNNYVGGEFCPDLVALPYDAPMIPPIEIYMLNAGDNNLQTYTENQLLTYDFDALTEMLGSDPPMAGSYIASVETGICKFGSVILPYIRVCALKSKNSQS